MALTLEQQNAFQQELMANRAQEALAQDTSTEDSAQGTQSSDQVGVVFFGIILALFIITDGVEFFTGGTVGWVLGQVIDFLVAPVLFLFYSSFTGKNIFGSSRQGRMRLRNMLVALAGESMPIMGALPLRSVLWGWTHFATSPRATRWLGQAARVVRFLGPQGAAVAKGMNVASTAATLQQGVAEKK